MGEIRRTSKIEKKGGEPQVIKERGKETATEKASMSTEERKRLEVREVLKLAIRALKEDEVEKSKKLIEGLIKEKYPEMLDEEESRSQLKPKEQTPEKIANVLSKKEGEKEKVEK